MVILRDVLFSYELDIAIILSVCTYIYIYILFFIIYVIGFEKTCHVANLLILQNRARIVSGQKKKKTFFGILVSLVHC